ncbi:lasso peptide [Moorena sp. SIO4G3]|uniref:lasso peptide n=1 Tax=Moorena sp. SIO4G3 TaxID=2607821 RepID=UPI00142970EE|nr:lasso peptide [Moorena sp. SIO4G3]NEO81215.1 lasso peptide [Moorena sp. SIO4G3]
MEKSYATPEMIVHGTIEEITQLGGVNTPLDVLIFNGDLANPAAESDGSSSLDCDNNGNCDLFKLEDRLP